MPKHTATTEDVAASIQIMLEYLQENRQFIETPQPPEVSTPKVGRLAELLPFELANVLLIFNEAKGDKTFWGCVKEWHAAAWSR